MIFSKWVFGRRRNIGRWRLWYHIEWGQSTDWSLQIVSFWNPHVHWQTCSYVVINKDNRWVKNVYLPEESIKTIQTSLHHFNTISRVYYIYADQVCKYSSSKDEYYPKFCSLYCHLENSSGRQLFQQKEYSFELCIITEEEYNRHVWTDNTPKSSQLISDPNIYGYHCKVSIIANIVWLWKTNKWCSSEDVFSGSWIVIKKGILHARRYICGSHSLRNCCIQRVVHGGPWDILCVSQRNDLSSWRSSCAFMSYNLYFQHRNKYTLCDSTMREKNDTYKGISRRKSLKAIRCPMVYYAQNAVVFSSS